MGSFTVRSTGGEKRLSDLAIETTLTLRLVFRLPVRQTQGFVRSVLAAMSAGVDAPTSRRSREGVSGGMCSCTPSRPRDLCISSSTARGFSIVGGGEWAAANHGGRGKRGWKKLHLGVDRSGVIVAHALTEATVNDATGGIDLIGAADGEVTRVTADMADDTIVFYDAAGAEGATVVVPVPPTKAATVSRRRPRSRARDRTIETVKKICLTAETVDATEDEW